MAFDERSAHLLAAQTLLKLSEERGYTVVGSLGRGGFGAVFAGWCSKGNPVAFKVVRKDMVLTWLNVELNVNNRKIWPSEQALLLLARDIPGVITLLDDFSDDYFNILVLSRNPWAVDLLHYSQQLYNEKVAQCNILPGEEEYVAGSPLFMMGEERACYIFRQVVQQQWDLMQRGILHRDLKLENLLVDPTTGEVTVIDFGAADVIISSQQMYEQKMFWGTSPYTPPEYIFSAFYTAESQLTWGLGVLLYSLLTGGSPTNILPPALLAPGGSEDEVTKESVAAEEAELRAFIANALDHVPAEWECARHLLSRCLTRKPKDRIQLVEILRHPWLVHGPKQWPV